METIINMELQTPGLSCSLAPSNPVHACINHSPSSQSVGIIITVINGRKFIYIYWYNLNL
jgi:hypothetical protein